jgi:hypothetical protein
MYEWRYLTRGNVFFPHAQERGEEDTKQGKGVGICYKGLLLSQNSRKKYSAL